MKISRFNLPTAKIIFFLLCYVKFGMSSAYAFDYLYEKRNIGRHVFHVVTVNPQKYNINIVKSNDGAIGRETVASMAERSKAQIAVNAGFFEIGGQKDGAPSGTLVIDGKVYAIKNQIQPLLIFDSNKISIDLANPQIYLQKKINSSMVSGIPLLIKDGIIDQGLLEKKAKFYINKHARTAVGVKPNGEIVIIVVEHVYRKDLLSVTMGEVNSIIKEKGQALSKKYNKPIGDITITELKEILEEEFASINGSQGLSLIELAEFMKQLGCRFAINLDGGGSSTLWIDGMVVNQTFGDEDEGNGLKTLRAVSDAIIFKKITNKY